MMLTVQSGLSKMLGAFRQNNPKYDLHPYEMNTGNKTNHSVFLHRNLSPQWWKPDLYQAIKQHFNDS